MTYARTQGVLAGRLIGLMLVAGYVSACGGGTETCQASAAAPTVTVRDSAGVEVVTIEVAADSLPEWELDSVVVTIPGTSRGAEPDLSLVLGALWLSDGRIVVPEHQSRELHLYDASGVYQRSFGGAGDGPGEFRRMDAATVGRGDTISVYDRADGAGGAVQLYHPEAGFVRSASLPPRGDDRPRREAWSWGPGTYLGLLEEPGTLTRVGHPTARLWPTSAILELLGGRADAARTISLPGSYSALDESGMDVRMFFSHQPVVLLGPDRLLYGSGERFELHEVDRSFVPRRIIRWPSVRTTLGAEEVDRVRADWLAPRDRESQLVQQILEILFAPELLPEDRPAIGRTFFDDEGRIWVGRFETVGSGETLWYVLEPGGAPLAKLRIPREKRVLLSGVQGDLVLLAGRDALDVPLIEVVRLRK
ncbi:hypothetical protein [Candidatus Palauibacter sp.]|uniref:hypothetical protein n=1 Tax=Candidatus Palauibacter sp. TaxID=3101350 RepID=UPI003C6ED058